jgi:hypothetical protein
MNAQTIHQIETMMPHQTFPKKRRRLAWCTDARLMPQGEQRFQLIVLESILAMGSQQTANFL